VVKMGRKHVKDGAITITQKKSGETVEVTIPILPALNVVLDEVQARRINHVRRVAQTSWPTRRSARAWTPQGVLPRGGRGRYDGHKTLGEVMRYTAAVDRKKLAASGMAKIKP
jgi:hypothetical protein